MAETMPEYDVIVVGARVAGAATAMLLARAGQRVLLVDRARYGTDTLSTHALMRGGVFLLSHWGLLDRVIAAGTPPIHRTRFDYGTDRVTLDIKPTRGVDALYAPRRTVLDTVIVDAAAAAGAHLRFGALVTDLLRDETGRVTGIRLRDHNGAEYSVRAPLTVGADGIRSTVARRTGAATLRTGTGASAIIYGYWSHLPAVGYEWCYRPGHSAGIIPTNNETACVFAGIPHHRLTPAARTDLPRTYRQLLDLATDGADGRFAEARPPRRLHTWVGRPSFIRQSHGPGWALIGDAGAYLDPLSTHGITDALRDALLLVEAILAADLDRFARHRAGIVDPLFTVVDHIARYDWSTAQLQHHLLELSSVMSAETELIATRS